MAVPVRYSRAYIHHLGKAGELLGGLLVSQHNIFFMNELMSAIRQAIREGTLDEEEQKWLAPGLRSRDYDTTPSAAPHVNGGSGGARVPDGWANGVIVPSLGGH